MASTDTVGKKITNSPFYSCVLGCQGFGQAKVDLVLIKTLLLSNANYFAIMLT